MMPRQCLRCGFVRLFLVLVQMFGCCGAGARGYAHGYGSGNNRNHVPTSYCR